MMYTPVKTVTVTAVIGYGGAVACSGCPGVMIDPGRRAEHVAWHTRVVPSGPGQVTATWVAPDPAPSGYTVGRDGEDTTGAGPWAGAAPGSATSWVFDRLLPATRYTVKVIPAGLAAGVAAATFTTPADTTVPPPTPVGAGYDRTQPAGPAGPWRLVLGDDFTGPGLDPALWSPHRPDGTGDGEKGWGSEWFHSSQVTVGGGVCRLTMVNDRSKGGSWQKSGVISTGGGRWEATPGVYVEARINFPDATSVWPAFWMFGPGWPPEFDIIEMGVPPYSGTPAMGDTGDRLVATWHGKPSGGSNNSWGGGRWGPGGLLGGWHVYGCRWRPDATTFDLFLDGVLQKTVGNCTPPAERMRLVLSHQAQYQGDVNPSPCFYDIDWVKCWAPA